MWRIFLFGLLFSFPGNAMSFADGALRFNPEAFEIKSLTMPDGTEVKFKAYENIYYVGNVEDENFQKLNFYAPLDFKGMEEKDAPILMRNNVGGYMASPPGEPAAHDATGRALAEGYAVCIPGARGNGASILKNNVETQTGIAPNGLLDLKAAVAYLHYNDAIMPGSAERIFTDGVSAGGAMSALLGITGDAEEYKPYLKAMGAAPASDAVYASICYCPITDLNHADMEYEWLYQPTNKGVRHLTEAQNAISEALAKECPAYLDSLDLRAKNGEKITAANYMDFLKQFIMASAQKALEEGCEIPEGIGIIRYEKPALSLAQRLGDAPVDGKMARPSTPEYTDYVTDIDWDKYLNYVASQKELKLPPAFDAWGVLERGPTPENRVFGNAAGEPANFTDFSLRQRTGDADSTLEAEMQIRVFLMNPMDFIDGGKRPGAAGFWHIRHGAKDRDTSFLVPVNLATKLANAGFDVNFALPWNRPHSGDYNLDDLFDWIAKVK